MKKPNLLEALRPKTLDDVIGHNNIKPAIKKFIEQERQQWLFYGPTGTGKTSLAHIVAREFRGADYPGDGDVLNTNGADCRSVDFMRELVRQTQTYPMTGKYRVIILDEAQNLTEESKNLLLTPLEDAQSANVWILCTMDVKSLHRALRDRCASFELIGMRKSEREQLVSRAAQHLGYTDDTTRFLRLINDKDLISARDILGAFERLANGMTAEVAVGS